jgi:hypothetical protein
MMDFVTLFIGAGPLEVYTQVMSRRFIALLVVLVMGLQGPILAFAAASPMAAGHCCPGHQSGTAGNGCTSCPAGVLAATCCATNSVTTAMLSSPVSLLASPSGHLLPESGSVSFATENPAPQFRPPIV